MTEPDRTDDGLRDDEFEQSVEVQTEYERGRQDGIKSREQLAEDVLARAIADELEIEALKARVVDLNRRLVTRTAPQAPDTGEGLPRQPTEAMLKAARDWSVVKYGRGIGNDAAIGCWQVMFDASRTAPQAPDTPWPHITLEGNCIVDDSHRQTIAKFDLYNGSREELQAVIDRANAAPPKPAPDALRDALEPFATFGLDESGNDIRDGLMRDRICDWFGPADFDAARRALSLQPTGDQPSPQVNGDALRRALELLEERPAAALRALVMEECANACVTPLNDAQRKQAEGIGSMLSFETIWDMAQRTSQKAIRALSSTERGGPNGS